jgi:hypothetical protein
MRVLEANVCYPINAMGGLYIHIEGTSKEIYGNGSAADLLAIKTANERGRKGNGKASVGMPCKTGVLTYTKSYWFHEQK